MRSRPTCLIAVAATTLLAVGCSPAGTAGSDPSVEPEPSANAIDVEAPPTEKGAPAAPVSDESVAATGAADCIPVGASKIQGRAAVDRLGPNLDRAAMRVRMTPESLRTKLLDDDTLWLDPCGRPFYVEPPPPPFEGRASTPIAEPAVLPYASTFKLHSRPNALRTLYLDFDGTRIEGTYWNTARNNGQSWTAIPFDIDGSPSTFSNSERDVIQSVWQRVSEDFAPFDIDVTTEDPGFDAIDRTATSDQIFGTRALITNDPVVGDTCECGGIAYVGVFDWVEAVSAQPALVFAHKQYFDAKNIAEAVSHEVGHNLGLNHDGTSAVEYYVGAGAWAPIMGIGYNRPLVQWSKGEYADANNTQDDTAIIAAAGPAIIPDDHGNTSATATALGSSLPTGATGTISTPADVDRFSFVTAGGSTTISVAPAAVSPNLDAKLTVFNSSGTSIGSSDPASALVTIDTASGLGATLTLTLAAGTYFAQVDGIGAGAVGGTGYSDYASLGRYAISVVATAGPAIATTALPPSVVGVAYNEILAVAGGSAPYAWSLAAGALPAGLVLSSTGTISGTPTTATSATFTLRVTDGAARVATRVFTVAPGLQITSRNLPDVSRGTTYSTTLAAGGGTAPYSWTVTSGALPSGLSLAGAGTITGTPTTSTTASFTLRVTDSQARTTTRPMTLTVVEPLSTSAQTLPQADVGATYSANLTASGGRQTLVWSLVSGTVPPGLRVNDVGSVTGTATAPGTFNFVVRATDRSGRTVTASISISAITITLPPNDAFASAISFSVASAGSTTGLSVYASKETGEPAHAGFPGGASVWWRFTPTTTTSVTLSTEGSSFDTLLAVYTGTSVGALTSVAGNDDNGGGGNWSQVTFAVTAGTTYRVAVDGYNGASGSIVLGWTPSSPLVIDPGAPPAGVQGTPYTHTFVATGGRTPYAWSISSGTPPAGLTLSSAGVLSGTPTTAASSTFTVRVTDFVGTQATRSFTITTVPGVTRLTGTATTPSDPVAGTQVWLYSTTSSNPVTVLLAGSGGAWSADVIPGSYQVQVVPPSGRHLRAWAGGATRASATSFTVTAGQTITTGVVTTPLR